MWLTPITYFSSLGMLQRHATRYTGFDSPPGPAEGKVLPVAQKYAVMFPSADSSDTSITKVNA